MRNSFENGGNDAIRGAGKSGRSLSERSCKMYAVSTYSESTIERFQTIQKLKYIKPGILATHTAWSKMIRKFFQSFTTHFPFLLHSANTLIEFPRETTYYF